MPHFASNQVSSPKRMYPPCGRSSPARHRRAVVFPEPEGPNKTVSEKWSTGRRRRTCIGGPSMNCFSNSATSSGPISSLPIQEMRHRERDERRRQQHEGSHGSPPIIDCLNLIVDRDGYRARGSGDVSAHHEHDTELSKRVRKAQDQSGDDACT